MQFTIEVMKHDLVIEIKAAKFCLANEMGSGLSKPLTELVLSVGVLSNL
jgi:hypothetical protein